MEQFAEVFGLTQMEAKIYNVLLGLGPSLAGLITRKSGIHRRSVYDALERLIQKGLVGYIVKNNRKYFEATNPERLVDLLREKEATVQHLLPQLKAKYQQTKEKSETLFYRGKNGLKSVFEDQLAVAKEILIISASSLAKEVLQYYFQSYDKRRIQKKIKIKLLYSGKERRERSIKLAEVKYLPKDYDNPASMNIYADHVAIIHWSKENPFVILIRDREIADGYRNHFNLLWKIARK
ncbi:MAG TPA: helix-turn-helix domain-containing protein [Candidatus Nanoarchaeia archaeon]|nr:helix-turn-helix domain-containing protein [Candidatus Nanoarchaeia archaeon]